MIWAGLGRRPRRGETPTIVAEFVSGRKRDRIRDYETKRAEYLDAGVKAYWVFDRFQRTLTVFSRGKEKRRVVREHQIFRTDLLPGFELPLSRLFALADSWPEGQADSET